MLLQKGTNFQILESTRSLITLIFDIVYIDYIDEMLYNLKLKKFYE